MAQPKIRLKGFSGSWNSKRIRELASFYKGFGFSKGDLVSSGYPIILYGRLYTNYETEITNVDTFVLENSCAFLSQGDEVVIPASGETAEEIAVASAVKQKDVVLGGDLNVLRFNPNIIDQTFAALSITYTKVHTELGKLSIGKTVAHIHNGDISKVSLSFPSLTEQREIASYFRRFDSLISTTQTRIESLKQIKQACLQNMFPQKGEKTPKLRFKGFYDEWEEKKLGEIGWFNSNGVDKLSKPDEVPVNLLNYMDIYNRRTVTATNCHDLMQVTAKPEQLIKNNILAGDVFFTPTSETAEDIAHVMVIEEDLPNTVYSYHLMRFRPSKEWIDSLFPNWGFECQFVRQQFVKEAKGVQRFVISKPSFESISVLLPSLKEQHKIASFFRSIDSQITIQEHRLEKLKQLKAACLDQMFV